MIFINCVFKTTCIVIKSSYEKEELKLHQSLLGVKGGGGAKQPSEQSSLQHLAVTQKINICRPNFCKSTTKSTNTLRKCT